MTTKVTVETKDPLRTFIDDGDLILGHALETKEGREWYVEVEKEIRRQLRSSVRLHYLLSGPGPVNLKGKYVTTLDRRRALSLKMIEKAVADWIRDQLIA